MPSARAILQVVAIPNGLTWKKVRPALQPPNRLRVVIIGRDWVTVLRAVPATVGDMLL